MMLRKDLQTGEINTYVEQMWATQRTKVQT